MGLIRLKNEEIRSSEIARVFIGEFYENLFLSMSGGKKLRETNDERIYLPDIIIEEEKKLYDVKGSYKYNYYHLRDCQIQGYDNLLDRDNFKDFKLFFALFTHSIENITKNYKNKDDLFEDLAKKTESLIILPFEEIKKIHKEGKSRYEGNYYDWLTRLRRKDILELLKTKNDKKEYLSNEFIFDRYTIKPFKIIEIKN